MINSGTDSPNQKKRVIEYTILFFSLFFSPEYWPENYPFVLKNRNVKGYNSLTSN